MEQEQKFSPRPANLLKALGIDFKGFTDEERVMQKLLIEEYKKGKRSLIDEIKNWRERNPQASLGDTIRALYEEIEKDQP